MVRVVPAVALVDVAVAVDEFNGLEPLDHLEAELVFHPQPERGPMDFVEWLEIHFIGQYRLRMAHVLDGMAVVVLTALEALAEGIEDDGPYRRAWANELY